MAADMMLVMRGLAKLSQAVIDTQASTLRIGGAQAMAQSMQMTAEQSLGVAMQKMQVGKARDERGSSMGVVGKDCIFHCQTTPPMARCKMGDGASVS